MGPRPLRRVRIDSSLQSDRGAQPGDLRDRFDVALPGVRGRGIEVERDELSIAGVGDLVRFALFDQEQVPGFELNGALADRRAGGAFQDEEPLLATRMLVFNTIRAGL